MHFHTRFRLWNDLGKFLMRCLAEGVVAEAKVEMNNV